MSNGFASSSSGSGSTSQVKRARTRRREFVPRILSDDSTPTTQTSMWFSRDLQLGAGVLIIQPATNLVVILSEKHAYKDEKGVEFTYEHYFLPKGRKDVGESLEDTAVREGFEESGYRCTLLPLNIPHHAPATLSPSGEAIRPRFPCCEPIYVSTQDNPPSLRRRIIGETGDIRGGTEYITFWYVAQIPEDAVKESNTQMADEVGYITHLLPFSEATQLMERDGNWMQLKVLRTGFQLWMEYQDFKRKEELKRMERERERLANIPRPRPQLQWSNPWRNRLGGATRKFSFDS